MKYKIQLKNNQELLGLATIARYNDSVGQYKKNTSLGLFVKFGLENLSVRLYQKAFDRRLLRRDGKLTITLSKSELLALSLNANNPLSPFEQGIYNKSIAPLLHILS